MLGAVTLTRNVDLDKYSYSGYSFEFDSHSLFSSPNFDWCKNAIIFGVDNSSSVDIDNKKKDILVLCEAPTQGLKDTTKTTEAKYLSKLYLYLLVGNFN